MGTFISDFKPLPRQTTQLIPKFQRGAICAGSGALIPKTQSRAHWGREEAIHRGVNPRGVTALEHLEQIIGRDQGVHLAEPLGGSNGPAEVMVVTLLELGIFEIHDASNCLYLCCFAGLRLQRLPFDNAGTNTGVKEFPKYFPRLGRRQQIASWYFRATPAKEEENSPMIGLRIADGNEAGSRRGFAALETDEAIPQAQANPQPVAMRIK